MKLSVPAYRMSSLIVESSFTSSTRSLGRKSPSSFGGDAASAVFISSSYGARGVIRKTVPEAGPSASLW